MAHKAQYSEDIKTPPAIIAYANNLFETRENKSGRKQYGCVLLFPKATTDMSKISGIILEAAEKSWPGKAKERLQSELIKNPILDGDGKQGLNKETGERHPGYAGHWFIRCNSGEKRPPKVFGSNAVSRITDDTELPSGSTVFGVINAWTWNNEEQGDGVSLNINIVQLAKKAEGDEVLGGGGGGPDPEKFLEKIADEGETPEAAKTGDGAGGLFA